MFHEHMIRRYCTKSKPLSSERKCWYNATNVKTYG